MKNILVLIPFFSSVFLGACSNSVVIDTEKGTIKVTKGNFEKLFDDLLGKRRYCDPKDVLCKMEDLTCVGIAPVEWNLPAGFPALLPRCRRSDYFKTKWRYPVFKFTFTTQDLPTSFRQYDIPKGTNSLCEKGLGGLIFQFEKYSADRGAINFEVISNTGTYTRRLSCIDNKSCFVFGNDVDPHADQLNISLPDDVKNIEKFSKGEMSLAVCFNTAYDVVDISRDDSICTDPFGQKKGGKLFKFNPISNQISVPSSAKPTATTQVLYRRTDGRDPNFEPALPDNLPDNKTLAQLANEGINLALCYDRVWDNASKNSSQPFSFSFRARLNNVSATPKIKCPIPNDPKKGTATYADYDTNDCPDQIDFVKSIKFRLPAEVNLTDPSDSYFPTNASISAQGAVEVRMDLSTSPFIQSTTNPSVYMPNARAIFCTYVASNGTRKYLLDNCHEKATDSNGVLSEDTIYCPNNADCILEEFENHNINSVTLKNYNAGGSTEDAATATVEGSISNVVFE